MVSVVLLILDIPALAFVTTICVWIALLLTIVSLVDYIYKNHKIRQKGVSDMIVELISVGTELLLGNIVNTNAQYLSETMCKAGA